MQLGIVENNMDIYQKLKIQLGYDPSIPLWVTY